MADTTKDLNAWLEYNIQPQQLHTLLHPAMYGNGQLELMAELDRSRVSEVVCFGFGAQGLEYGRNNGEEHLVPAVYDAETGKKYLLSSSPGPGSNRLTVTFRPDRQVWRYEFDDLDVRVSLVLPRLPSRLPHEGGAGAQGGQRQCSLARIPGDRRGSWKATADD